MPKSIALCTAVQPPNGAMEGESRVMHSRMDAQRVQAQPVLHVRIKEPDSSFMHVTGSSSYLYRKVDNVS